MTRILADLGVYIFALACVAALLFEARRRDVPDKERVRFIAARTGVGRRR